MTNYVKWIRISRYSVRSMFNWQMVNKLILVCLIFLLFSGCSLRSTITVWATRPLIDGAFKSLMSEPDLDLARTAMESDLKLLDGLLEIRPQDRELLKMALQGYTGYALMFLEDEESGRAFSMYERARDYGLRLLAQTHKDFLSKEINYRQFKSLIPSLRERDLPIVYWTANAWFGAIYLQKTPAALADIPRAKELMQWVLDRDPHFFYSGPLWFFGSYYASLPPMLGGDIKLSAKFFSEALEKDGDRFLFGKILYARYFATQTLDRDLYIQTLENLKNLPIDEPEDLILINRVAQQKALILLEHVDDIF